MDITEIETVRDEIAGRGRRDRIATEIGRLDPIIQSLAVDVTVIRCIRELVIPGQLETKPLTYVFLYTAGVWYGTGRVPFLTSEDLANWMICNDVDPDTIDVATVWTYWNAAQCDEDTDPTPAAGTVRPVDGGRRYVAVSGVAGGHNHLHAYLPNNAVTEPAGPDGVMPRHEHAILRADGKLIGTAPAAGHTHQLEPF